MVRFNLLDKTPAAIAYSNEYREIKIFYIDNFPREMCAGSSIAFFGALTAPRSISYSSSSCFALLDVYVKQRVIYGPT